ncbi:MULTISPECIES: ATP phosphoribosyltransferase regulatory subunit [Acinetobacter]|jgi:ATP phosphoribosyltransferase regulatory subunit|uniref:ATP phosphoribosyltransferase regulatory subunit n=2 Tax=Acinetobacter junii TaxID=40215 RepID=A0AA42V5W6_ACIJU|nr:MULTISPECIES: ATP phosphoribosyltransferase regulatory subunit [Acinetobacter]EEY93295.1 ATP phosphoribosyltransferase, regulatory subunit [Acinetobacter junii SH205]MCU4397625.1 ATP phosphoribosyltransferase regulatory subunit [Acinetobacter junii]MCU4406524.1 ATP phosphoribosyltransferase regulatory subunit [Acinetobacter junii]MDA3502380.1 ATP phosphoribosyltransferase regulatory subunit [Acinetobacter sp. AOR34_HL]MDH1858764.1 ATP phosphoribosyltransferase regulatory subunit [Acinetobac
MTISETWLLPDGVADVLPEQAQVVETLRREALDFLAVRGYQLVYTPFIEYIESLSSLSESNQDLDLVTFKVIDQLSGRLLGVRADMTPQVARIDAHVRPIEGVARYCYAGTVLHTKPQNFNATRAPLQLGAELYGHDSIEADVEMIDVMLGLIEQAHTLEGAHLDLGHVGLFRSLVKRAGLNKNTENQLSDLYQRKALPELAEFTQDLSMGSDFYALGRYASDLGALKANLSQDILNDADFKAAFEALESTFTQIQSKWSNLNIGIDVIELRSYHYHTGLMYAIYAPNRAAPLAQGGRYDGIGEHFGRSRPATGFSCDLYALGSTQFTEIETIVAPRGNDQNLLKAIADARHQGMRVVQLLGKDDLNSVPYATHQMVSQNGQWVIEKI